MVTPVSTLHRLSQATAVPSPSVLSACLPAHPCEEGDLHARWQVCVGKVKGKGVEGWKASLKFSMSA